MPALTVTLLSVLACAQGQPAAGSPPAQAPAGGAGDFNGWVKDLEEQFFEFPKYDVRRFLEDYSDVDPSRTQDYRDFFDGLKHIPIGDSDDLWLSVGGQVRLRAEGFGNFNFGAPDRDDDGFYLLERYMLHTELNITPYFRLFAEGKVALADDRDLVMGRRPLDHDALDLQNAFAEVRLPLSDGAKLLFDIGRRELLFGRQRLISPLDWANSRRTFDGASAALVNGGSSLTAAWMKPVVVEKSRFNEPDPYVDLWTVYGTLADPFKIGTSLDGYVIGKHVHMPETPEVSRITLGARAWGRLGDGGLSYDIESAFQTGDAGDLDIAAFMVASELTLSLAGKPWKPWFALGFDYASGDSDPTDGQVETFDQIAPLGHAYYGFIDVVARQNAMDFFHKVRVAPTEKLTLQLDGHAFWLAENRDALYNAGGGVVRKGKADVSQSLGYELDFTAKFIFNHHLDVTGGYSHFFTGDFLSETGADDDIDFWYTQLQFTF